jgi:hypothetical protein
MELVYLFGILGIIGYVGALVIYLKDRKHKISH